MERIFNGIDMMTVISFFALILSGDVLAITVFGKKFGQYTPITICAIAFLSYFFGLIHLLRAGVWIIIALAAGIYIFSIFILVNRHAYAVLREGLNLPVLSVFIFIFALAVWGDYGQLANGYDDIGHWVDCVKTMVCINDFYANPIGHSTFGTYPPFMAMIQYVIQILHMTLTGSSFCEWINFLVFHVVMFSLFLPFLSSINAKKRTIKIWLSAGIIATVPTIFFQRVYSSTMIDPFLSVAAGAMFVTIIQMKEMPGAKLILCFIIPGLVLIKDLGLLFAVFGLILLLYQSIIAKQYKTFIYSSAGTIFAKVSWEIVKAANHTLDVKPNSVNWLNYIRALFGYYGKLEEYKIESVSNYRLALFNQTITVGNDYFRLSICFILIIAMVIIAYTIWCKRKQSIDEGKILQTNLFVYCAMLLVFLFGLGGVYMDKFVDTESVTLASYARYVSTVVNVLLVEIVLLFLMDKKNSSHGRLVVVLSVLILLSPVTNSLKYISRAYPDEEAALRQDANEFADYIMNNCEDGSRVYLVSQRNRGWDYLVIKLMSRPGIILQSIEGNDYNWSFAEKRNPDDIYTKEMSLDQWSGELFDEDKYDYVAIARSDNYLQNTFITMFDGVKSIEPHTIFRVDREKRKLLPVVN